MVIHELLPLQDGLSAQQALRLDQLVSGIAPSNIVVGASPFTYQNAIVNPVNILVSGGTVTTISISRDGINFFGVGLLTGQFHLSPGDFLRIVYVLAPTMTLIPL